jgi:hypothetical protein
MTPFLGDRFPKDLLGEIMHTALYRPKLHLQPVLTAGNVSAITASRERCESFAAHFCNTQFLLLAIRVYSLTLHYSFKDTVQIPLTQRQGTVECPASYYFRRTKESVLAYREKCEL